MVREKSFHLFVRSRNVITLKEWDIVSYFTGIKMNYYCHLFTCLNFLCKMYIQQMSSVECVFIILHIKIIFHKICLFRNPIFTLSYKSC
jgi:hypothetical protein